MFKKSIIVFLITIIFISVGISQIDSTSAAIGNANDYYSDGEYNKAIAKSLRALREEECDNNQKAELHYIMAQSHEKLGEEKKSMALYQFIVKSYPNTNVALLANTEL